ncbi:unnamed protein product [Miscanthus lutarioriparius]|uniref:Uncharacterized protein n=1 Tax=Miscanthus lutarioriparius TaxID=422564 RepID=A0A811SDN0_9POAL|nr:unnamed protein product [Miscanthus lutarioriparius]
MKMQQQELEQKLKELENFRSSFQEEHEKRMQAESALLSQGKELAQSHEEVQRMAIEIKAANEKLNELKQTKEVLELSKLQSELDETNQKVQLLTQDLEKKKEEADSVHFKLQDECHRRMQIEATLLMTEGLHSRLQEEMRTLTQDLDGSKKKLSELENNKLDLESTLKELKNTILGLNSEKDATLLQQ